MPRAHGRIHHTANYAISDRELVAIHEAGHCVAGVLLGSRVGPVGIGGHEGSECAYVYHRRSYRRRRRPLPRLPGAILACGGPTTARIRGHGGAGRAGRRAARPQTVLGTSRLDVGRGCRTARPRFPLARIADPDLRRTGGARRVESQPPSRSCPTTPRPLKQSGFHGNDFELGRLHGRFLFGQTHRLLTMHAGALHRGNHYECCGRDLFGCRRRALRRFFCRSE